MPSIAVAALVRSVPRWASCCSVMENRVIDTSPMVITSLGFKACILIFLPFTRISPPRWTLLMLQLPSSYRVKTAWVFETLGSLITISLRFALPITFSQWVTGSLSPFAKRIHAQISGSFRKETRGLMQRKRSSATSAGTKYRKMAIYTFTTVTSIVSKIFSIDAVTSFVRFPFGAEP